MDLYLQFGYGMMGLSRTLMNDWGRVTVILSPRDLEKDQLLRFGKEIADAGSNPMFDPQFYLPLADHHRLTSHDYWPSEYESGGFWSGSQIDTLLNELKSLNRQISSKSIILPGLFARRIDVDWLTRAAETIRLANRTFDDDDSLFMTVCLSRSVMEDSSQIEQILDESEQWNVDGVYLVCEHPDEYLVTNLDWLANLLDLIAGFRLLGYEVIVGYANQQMLFTAAAAASAVATGTWQNVRTFDTEKFQDPAENSARKRAIWYYCENTLSEYKIPALDLASRQGVLSLLKPQRESPIESVNSLFTVKPPSTAVFGEPDSFRHFINSIRSQAHSSHHTSFDQTLGFLRQMLDDSETRIKRLDDAGVSGGNRDFGDAIDTCRGALADLTSNRGSILRRKWAELI